MPIHEKLRHLRVIKNLSQQLIAEKLHISQNAYSLIESGKTKIDEQRILRLAKILDVHPFELFADENTHLSFNDKIKKHIETLNIDNKEFITRMDIQLTKKDEQIETLLLQVSQLFQMLNLKNNH